LKGLTAEMCNGEYDESICHGEVALSELILIVSYGTFQTHYQSQIVNSSVVRTHYQSQIHSKGF
jgi:hypothetical protein